MKTVRFALIGCGRIAGHHLRSLARIRGAKVVALCDFDATRVGPYAKEFGLPAYSDYHAMLEKEQVDVVNILTPNGMHPTHVLDVMRRYRKHVVVEKPLALRLDDVREMRETARRLRLRIFPVFQNRYNKAVRFLHQAIQKDKLGKLALGTVRLRWCRQQAYYERDAWRGTWAMDGGALTNQGVHHLDLLTHLMGPAEIVSAWKATRLVQVEVEDVCLANVRFRNGALGNIEVTTAVRPDNLEGSVSVFGEKGSAILGGTATNRLEHWSPAPGERDAHSEEIPDVYGFGHTPFFRDVVRELTRGIPHPITFEDGANSVRLLNALYLSTETGKPQRPALGRQSKFLGRRDPKLARLYTSPSK